MLGLCGKCNVVHGGKNNWGEIIPCHCLPQGMTCKDCKFYKKCSDEGITKGWETVCKESHERGFAKPGSLSYQERCNINRELDFAREKEEWTAMETVQQFIRLNHVALIDAYRQKRLSKRDADEALRAANGSLQHIDKVLMKKVLLQLYHERLLETIKRERAAELLQLPIFVGVEVSEEDELRGRGISDRLEKQKCAAPSVL